MRTFRISKFESRIWPSAIFTAALALAFLAVPLSSYGQQPTKVYRIGWFGYPVPQEVTPQGCAVPGTNWLAWPLWQAWIDGMREYGYVPGQNLALSCRFTGGQMERAPALASELVTLAPDGIMVLNPLNLRVLQQTTRTVPIVMAYIRDPVGSGFVASLAHPGGNVTGVAAAVGSEIVTKQLQLLKEAVPSLLRVAVLLSPPPTVLPQVPEMKVGARKLGLTVQFYEVRVPADVARAFAAMTKARADGLVVLPDPFVYTHAAEIIQRAARARLPAMYSNTEWVGTGGLMAYATNGPAMCHRAAAYVDKILRGAKPGDLPVEQPTKFDLLINLKTAKALGLTIPQSVLLQADEVIQ